VDETDLLEMLVDLSPTGQTVAAFGIVWISWRIRVIENRLGAVASVVNNCPTCRKRPPLAALLLLLAFSLSKVFWI